MAGKEESAGAEAESRLKNPAPSPEIYTHFRVLLRGAGSILLALLNRPMFPETHGIGHFSSSNDQLLEFRSNSRERGQVTQKRNWESVDLGKPWRVARGVEALESSVKCGPGRHAKSVEKTARGRVFAVAAWRL